MSYFICIHPLILNKLLCLQVCGSISISMFHLNDKLNNIRLGLVIILN